MTLTPPSAKPRRALPSLRGKTFTGDDDAALIERAKAGDGIALARLWSKYYKDAVAIASRDNRSFDAEDVAQQAFVLVFEAMRNGGGPTTSFRGYLATTIRNVIYTWGRRSREDAVEEIETKLEAIDTDYEQFRHDDRALVLKALADLPDRWRSVLVECEINGRTPAEVGATLGIRPGAASQLLMRAKEGLREKYIQAHLKGAAPGSDCAWARDRAGTFVRKTASERDTGKIEAHLAVCTKCSSAFMEARDVNRLLSILLVFTGGLGAAAAGTIGTSASASATTATATATGSKVGGIVVAEAAKTGVRGVLYSVGQTVTTNVAASAIVATTAVASVALPITIAAVDAAPASSAPSLDAEPADSVSDVEKNPVVRATKVLPPTIEPTPAPDAFAAPTPPPAPAPAPAEATEWVDVEIPELSETTTPVPAQPSATPVPAQPSATPAAPEPAAEDEGPTDEVTDWCWFAEPGTGISDDETQSCLLIGDAGEDSAETVPGDDVTGEGASGGANAAQ